MKQTLFFYDLETSGFDPREARIMQFAGQRTDLQLNPVGEAYNFLIKLSEDVLPDPDAILVTGITPQSTIAEGLYEAEFLKVFEKEIAVPGTIFTGYNTVRFDDEFIRYLMYRNFYDPYEWHWNDDRSRWDLLDVVRMTRALRPSDIIWPFDGKGKPSNRLELLSSANHLEHSNAHNALSDVRATIAAANLIRQKQPKLFEFLLQIRNKDKVKKFIKKDEPFIYTSGKYPSKYRKTTVVGVLSDHPKEQGVIVFDLRYDPSEFTNYKVSEIAEAMRYSKDKNKTRLPVKTLKYNRCPAIAPLGVLDDDSKERLNLNPNEYLKNYKALISLRAELSEKVRLALQMMEKDIYKRNNNVNEIVDARLYERFLPKIDSDSMKAVRVANTFDIENIKPNFTDERLNTMFTLYKARNYPERMNDEDRAVWEKFRVEKLLGQGQNSRAQKYFARLASLVKTSELSADKKFILEELQLYGQSVLPLVEDQLSS